MGKALMKLENLHKFHNGEGKVLRSLTGISRALDFREMLLEHIHKIKFGAGSFLPLNIGQKA
jgi:hypothetical protein